MNSTLKTKTTEHRLKCEIYKATRDARAKSSDPEIIGALVLNSDAVREAVTDFGMSFAEMINNKRTENAECL